MNPLMNDNRLNTLQRALGGLARRQQVIAGNLANVDTPGYRRQDVDFETELRSSFSGAGGSGLAGTNAGHMRAGQSRGSLLGIAGGDVGPTTSERNDGNNVDMDYEMTRLADTSLRYQLLTQATSTRFQTLTAIATRTT